MTQEEKIRDISRRWSPIKEIKSSMSEKFVQVSGYSDGKSYTHAIHKLFIVVAFDHLPRPSDNYEFVWEKI